MKAAETQHNKYGFSNGVAHLQASAKRQNLGAKSAVCNTMTNKKCAEARRGGIMLDRVFIKALMDERNVTRKALAVEAHLSESSVSRYLSGKRQCSVEFLMGLGKAFPDVDLRKFLLYK